MAIKKYIIKNTTNQFSAKLSHSQTSTPIIEKHGFSSHEEAMFWLEEELEKIKPSYSKMSFSKLANIIEINPQDLKAKEQLRYNIDSLKDSILFTLVIKENWSEKKASEHIKKICGKNWTESFKKAKDNTLDALIFLEQEKTETRLKNMLKYHQDSQWKGSEEALLLLEVIKKLPGDKIITTNINMEIESFDIKENGQVGYAKEHENFLLKKFDMGFTHKNSFIIRQFIPNSKEEVLKNGKKILIPWKALYGFILSEDGIVALPAEEVEYSMNHDCNGNPIQPEELVIYKDFSEVFTL